MPGVIDDAHYRIVEAVEVAPAARLTGEELALAIPHHGELLTAAAGADVASVSTASLPPLSNELALRQLLGLSLAHVREAEAEVEAEP